MILPAFAFALAVWPGLPLQAEPVKPAETPTHVTHTFPFEIAASIARLAPLFGPEGERSWAGEPWNPVFLYPQPATDVQGAVFTVQHGPHSSVWVATVFDPSAGRMQYVAVIPGVMVSLIDVTLTAIDPRRTRVEVTYARTALDPTQNDSVQEMGQRDNDSGPEWQAAIEKTLSGDPK